MILFLAFTIEYKENNKEQKETAGIMVLQTNVIDKSAKEIYELYKRRWGIEVFYNYLKNQANYTSLHAQDYYQTQGLAFIMLISALIYEEFKKAVQEKVKGKSITDCLLQARKIKAHKIRGVWMIGNMLKKQFELFNSLNTTDKNFVLYT